MRDEQVGRQLLRLNGRLARFTGHVVTVGLSWDFAMLTPVFLFALVLLAAAHGVGLFVLPYFAVADAR